MFFALLSPLNSAPQMDVTLFCIFQDSFKCVIIFYNFKKIKSKKKKKKNKDGILISKKEQQQQKKPQHLNLLQQQTQSQCGPCHRAPNQLRNTRSSSRPVQRSACYPLGEQKTEDTCLWAPGEGCSRNWSQAFLPPLYPRLPLPR